MSALSTLMRANHEGGRAFAERAWLEFSDLEPLNEDEIDTLTHQDRAASQGHLSDRMGAGMSGRNILSRVAGLRATADAAKERLDGRNERREAALDACFPGPPPRDIEAARAAWEEADVEATAAAEDLGEIRRRHYAGGRVMARAAGADFHKVMCRGEEEAKLAFLAINAQMFADAVEFDLSIGIHDEEFHRQMLAERQRGFREGLDDAEIGGGE